MAHLIFGSARRGKLPAGRNQLRLCYRIGIGIFSSSCSTRIPNQRVLQTVATRSVAARASGRLRRWLSMLRLRVIWNNQPRKHPLKGRRRQPRPDAQPDLMGAVLQVRPRDAETGEKGQQAVGVTCVQGYRLLLPGAAALLGLLGNVLGESSDSEMLAKGKETSRPAARPSPRPAPQKRKVPGQSGGLRRTPKKLPRQQPEPRQRPRHFSCSGTASLTIEVLASRRRSPARRRHLPKKRHGDDSANETFADNPSPVHLLHPCSGRGPVAARRRLQP